MPCVGHWECWKRHSPAGMQGLVVAAALEGQQEDTVSGDEQLPFLLLHHSRVLQSQAGFLRWAQASGLSWTLVESCHQMAGTTGTAAGSAGHTLLCAHIGQGSMDNPSPCYFFPLM